MKTYKHLWEQLISDENILLAIKNVSKGNFKRKKIETIKRDPERYIPTIRKWIETHVPFEHKEKEIHDGISAKKRIIVVPSMKEHFVHHALINVLKPIFMKGMYEHSYASIPNRGCHRGKNVIKKWIRRDKKNVKYCLKLDIRKYFDSINQQTLIKMLNRKITDSRVRVLLLSIISTTKRGIPIGFYTSQWFSNFYLQDFDHYVKEVLKAKHYIRYADDIVIFDSNKRRLHKIKNEIEIYLRDMLSLSLKDNWQLFKFHNTSNKGRFLDFMGFRFYSNRITIRRKILLKASRKAIRISKKKHVTVYDARQLVTYISLIRHADVYNWYKNHILMFVDIKALKKIISSYSKSAHSSILLKKRQSY